MEKSQSKKPLHNSAEIIPEALYKKYPYFAQSNEGQREYEVFGHWTTCNGVKYTGAGRALTDEKFIPTHYLVRNGKTILLMCVLSYPNEEYDKSFYTETEWEDMATAAIRIDGNYLYGVEDGDQYFAIPEELIARM